MTRDEVKNYASLGELPALHAELLGILQQPTIETVRIFNHHGKDLVNLLQCYAKSLTDSADPGEDDRVKSEADESSSRISSSDSDSSDSEPDSDSKEK